MKLILHTKTDGKRGCANKDTCGGFGSHTWVGNSLPARALECAKKNSVRFPVHSLGCLAAIFKKAGWEVKAGENGEAERADLVLAPVSIVDHRGETRLAREAARKAGAPLGLYGAFPSARPGLFLDQADFVIQGEPERAAMDLAEGKTLAGLTPSERVADLDGLPFPDWTPFPYRSFDYGPTLPWRPFMPILSSRGCPMPCGTYCPFPLLQGTQWRARSAAGTLEEIRYLRTDYGARSIMFRDPYFALNPGRAREIAEGILNGQKGLRWGVETYLSALDDDLIALMARAGLRSIETGVETSHLDTLESLGRKKETTRRIAEKIRRTEALGVKVSAFYILGLPGESEERVRATLSFARTVNSFGAQFSIYTVYPGSKAFEETFGDREPDDWEKFDQYTPAAPGSGISTDGLLRLKETAFVRYYFRPRWIWKLFLSRIRDRFF